MMIKTLELKSLIEPFIFDQLTENQYKTTTIPAIKLLKNTRFDLGFKLYYLSLQDKDKDFAEKIYKEHIRAFTKGKFIEYGNENKNTIEKYLDDFKRTLKDITLNGFDASKTLIPVSQDGAIINGAHRVTSAITNNKEVTCVNIKEFKNINYDYKFFAERGVPAPLLDAAATAFVEHDKKSYIAFIWPSAKGKDKKLENLVPNIIYRKDITLNRLGAHNILSEVYAGEPWLGTIKNNFSGVSKKLEGCFDNFGPVRIIAFQSESLESVLKIKKDIRNLFNIDKHSVHITDTHEEAVKMARIIFNANGIHFLNKAQPNNFSSTYKKISTFKAFLKKHNSNPQNNILDGSMVLSVYGIREAADIDYLSDDNIISNDKNISHHDSELQFYNNTKNALIFNPENYFYFKDIKFVSFDQTKKMKNTRAKKNKESKDINDVAAMNRLDDSSFNTTKTHLASTTPKSFTQNIYQKIKMLFQKLITSLKPS